MFHRLSSTQLDAVIPYLAGRSVYDLGCGEITAHHGRFMRKHPCQIVGVDRAARQGRMTLIVDDDDTQLSPVSQGTTAIRGIAVPTIRAAFADLPAILDTLGPLLGPVQTAIVSWPATHGIDGLVGVLERAEVVIYLGSNVDGSACGTPELFEHLSRRPVLGAVPERQGSLVIYGNSRQGRPHRILTGEERAGLALDQPSVPPYTFEEAWEPWMRALLDPSIDVFGAVPRTETRSSTPPYAYPHSWLSHRDAVVALSAGPAESAKYHPALRLGFEHTVGLRRPGRLKPTSAWSPSTHDYYNVWVDYFPSDSRPEYVLLWTERESRAVLYSSLNYISPLPLEGEPRPQEDPT